MGRNTEYQAILPIFGKVLNISKSSVQDIVHNLKLGLIIAALGAGIKDTFDINNLKYHKVIIASDQDPDGLHIRCLYMTFFYQYMPQLIEHGYFYIAASPLYKVVQNKKNQYFYSKEELKKANLSDNCTVGYIKGLGELSPELLWETTMDPKHRRLYRVTIDDAEEAKKMINICMGDDVSIRKKYLMENINF